MIGVDKKKNYTGLLNFSSSFLSIIVGLVFGYIILLVTNHNNATKGIITILQGGFFDGASGIGQLFYIATPIIMTGLAVGFAFKTGLFNIGAPGQFTMGAFFAIYIGINWTWLPKNIHWLVALIGAGIAGALWGAIPGILKAFCNVNEVISSIMTNYIAMYLANMLISTDASIYDKIKNQTLPVASSANLPKFGMDKLFGSSYGNIGIIIAILFVIIIYIILEKTTFGYELKACGKSINASQYAGINSKRSVILSMIISGVLAGVGGGLLYLYGTGKYLQISEVILAEGFTGISVALLGLSNPIGILIVALFIAHITIGGYNIQLYGYTSEIIDIIIAIIIYFGAFSLLFKNIISRILNKLKKEEVE